jgi:hypothetical protein
MKSALRPALWGRPVNPAARRLLATAALAAAILATGAGSALAGHYECEGRPVSGSTCPDGDLASYVSDPVQAYQSTPVRPVTRAELDRMDAATRREAARIARIWTRSGRLSQSQVDAIQRGTCILAPFANPELLCVQGR